MKLLFILCIIASVDTMSFVTEYLYRNTYDMSKDVYHKDVYHTEYLLDDDHSLCNTYTWVSLRTFLVRDTCTRRDALKMKQSNIAHVFKIMV